MTSAHVSDEKDFEIIKNFGEKLLKDQQESLPEFEKVFQENFWELLA